MVKGSGNCLVIHAVTSSTWILSVCVCFFSLLIFCLVVFSFSHWIRTYTIFISKYWTLNTFWRRVLSNVWHYHCIHTLFFVRSLLPFSNISKQNLISMYEFYYCRFLFSCINFERCFYRVSYLVPSILDLASVWIQYQLLLLLLDEGGKKTEIEFKKKGNGMSYAFVAKNFVENVNGKWQILLCASSVSAACVSVSLSVYICVCTLFIFLYSLPICVWLSLSLEVHTKLSSLFSEVLYVYVPTYCHSFYFTFFSNVWWVTYCYCFCCSCCINVVRIYILLIQQLIYR